jgi:hypothetical protein
VNKGNEKGRSYSVLQPAPLEAVMDLLRNGLLMRKTGGRWRTELTEKFAFLGGLSAEFITRSSDFSRVFG